MNFHFIPTLSHVCHFYFTFFLSQLVPLAHINLNQFLEVWVPACPAQTLITHPDLGVQMYQTVCVRKATNHTTTHAKVLIYLRFFFLTIHLLSFVYRYVCMCALSNTKYNHITLLLSCSLFFLTAVVVCPVLSPPENGFFIQNVCNNQFNSACGVRCLTGFDLQGDGIRLCQPDGSWSGVQPNCRGEKGGWAHLRPVAWNLVSGLI